MKASDAIALRTSISERLNRGQSPTQIAQELGCSRTTIYKVLALLEDPASALLDGRLSGRGRPKLYSDAIWELILTLRQQNQGLGPRQLYHRVLREADSFGIVPADVPSPSTIGRYLHELGLARKPVGPHDLRVYPDMRPTEPGTLTIDTWGPWSLRATRLYLCTIQDRYTRLALAVPALGDPGRNSDPNRRVTAEMWARTILLGQSLLLDEQHPLERVYSDNGIGMMPVFGHLTAGARTVLALGARLIFIPPAQPWRNGRLERFHWTMECEYWCTALPRDVNEAYTGLTDWLNYYNLQRPHAALRYKAPADQAPWAPTLQPGFWRIETPELPEQPTGVVEAIRIVYNDGVVDLWHKDRVRVSPVLGGQFVRVIFDVTGQPSVGRIVYNRHKGQDIVVARFNHTLGVAGRDQAEPVVTETVLVDFDPGLVRDNQRLDEDQLENQVARTYKRRRVEREPA
jgi:transposase InsO family protein